jgi:acetolactate synthase-1/2/3 large subunit
MHHEQACTMAAEAYARIAGRPAVSVLTTGPGAINGLNGVFGAYTDSIPMIVLSGQVKRETCLDFQNLPTLRQLGDQEGPTVALARPVCKFAASVRTPEAIATLLPHAYRIAVSGRPGPVWLDIPLDIQSSSQAVDIPPPEPPESPPAIDPAELDRIIARLRQARRPLLLGGTGVRLAKAEARLLALAERHGIPLATAWTHDLIASDHPLFAGRPGSIGTRAGNFTLQAADFVLVIGSRLNIRQTTYNWASFAKNAHLVQVDIDSAELAKPGVRPAQALRADAGDFLDALAARLPAGSLPDFSPWQAWVREIGVRYAARHEHPLRDAAPLDPYAAVAAVFDHLGEEDVIACGNASACILPFQIGHLKTGQRLFSNSGSASMGYDLPAALGAARAVADRHGRVVCFAGDGSLQMNIQELQTLHATQANVTIIVINNSGYASIWQTHENFFGKVVGATPASGVTFPDYVAVAQAYGIPAWRLRNAEDLKRLPELLAGRGPCLIDLQVDPRQEFAPRIKSRLDANGRFSTPELDDMYPFLPESELAAVRASIPDHWGAA